jgi:hypothetical protein
MILIHDLCIDEKLVYTIVAPRMTLISNISMAMKKEETGSVTLVSWSTMCMLLAIVFEIWDMDSEKNQMVAP